MNSPPTSLSSILAQPGAALIGTQAGPETSSLRDQGSSRLGVGSQQTQTQAQADDDLSTGQAALLTYLRDHCPPGTTAYASTSEGGTVRDDQVLAASLPRPADGSGFPSTAAFDTQLSDPNMFAGGEQGATVASDYDAYVDPALAALAQRDLITADRHAALFPPMNYGGQAVHDPDAVNAALQAKSDKGEMGGKRKRPVMPHDPYAVVDQSALGAIPGASLLTAEGSGGEDEGSAAKKSKDGKDSKLKRAEQNRKAQQAFRKRREEHIKKLEYDAAALEEVTKARDEALEKWQYVRLAWETSRIEIAALQATLVNLTRQTALHITKPDGSLYLSSSSNDTERPPTELTTATDLEVAFQILQSQAKAIALRNQGISELHRSSAAHPSVGDGSRPHDA